MIIPHNKVNDLITKQEKLSLDPVKWDKFYSENCNKKVFVEFPMGEITNPNILGFVWVWKLQNKIINDNITDLDKFNAQGLEGKISIETDFITALIVYKNLPKFRCQIKEV